MDLKVDLDVRDFEQELPKLEKAPGCVIAVAGGKGGSGKSFLSANLAVYLASQGAQVVVIDADLGGANLHTCLGVTRPKQTLSDFVNRKVETLADVIVPTDYKGLKLISGAVDLRAAANPKFAQKSRLLRGILELRVDFVVLDLGAGTAFNVLDFFVIADIGILTVVREPTSIENAYQFVKAAYYRHLKHLQLLGPFRALLKEAMLESESAGLRSPADLISYVSQRSAQTGQILQRELGRMPLKLVVNQARLPEEYQLGNAMTAACRKYLGISMEFLGTIPYDQAVWESIRERRPVVDYDSEAAASQSLCDIGEILLMRELR